MDLLPAKEASTFPFDEIIVWHLSDPEFSEGNKVDKANAYANNLASGIDVLHSKSIFVPRLFGEQLLQKMKQIENRFWIELIVFRNLRRKNTIELLYNILM